MKIALIAVIDQNKGIGKNNKLLCYLPADLKRFKALTIGNNIIMGRKTFESLPNGPLPNRNNIIVTQNIDYHASGCCIAHSLNQALEFSDKGKDCYIIGGAQIYSMFIEVADLLYITKIHHTFDADTYFPVIKSDEWHLLETVLNQADDKNLYSYSFMTYSRVR